MVAIHKTIECGMLSQVFTNDIKGIGGQPFTRDMMRVTLSTRKGD